MLHRTIGALAFAWACCLSANAVAQTYPARPVTIVVPNAAGGGTDTVARLIADQLSKQMGQSFIVENKTAPAWWWARWPSRRPRRTATCC
jgi:tripartite-type tricarboxylate transporter receptor subunit TctC